MFFFFLGSLRRPVHRQSAGTDERMGRYVAGDWTVDWGIDTQWRCCYQHER